MIIQGIIETGKSYLIDCIRKIINNKTPQKMNPSLALAPTRVTSYNIRSTTIHTSLQIPIKYIHPLHGQCLKVFQEDFKHLKYILIDEMSFLGPKLLLKIDTHPRDAFPQRQHKEFGGLSITLIGNLGQLLSVMDKPIYASHSRELAL